MTAVLNDASNEHFDEKELAFKQAAYDVSMITHRFSTLEQKGVEIKGIYGGLQGRYSITLQAAMNGVYKYLPRGGSPRNGPK